MSIYIDQKVDDRLSAALKTLLLWHKKFPIVAVGSFDEDRGGVVSLYQDDCSTLSTDISPRSGIQVTALEWHPGSTILFVGWESGELTVWNHQEKIVDNIKKHNQVLCVIRCSDNGTRLVTGDVGGMCIGWKIESKGTLTTVFIHDVKDAITDITFRSFHPLEKDEEISRLARAAVNGDEKALNLFSSWSPSFNNPHSKKVNILPPPRDSQNFFVGSVSGIVFYISESGVSEEVLQMETGIRYLLYYQERDILIVVTESLILAEYNISSDGSLTEFSKIKMSGKNAEITVMWAGDSTLAVCSGEKIIRLWNVDDGNNNALSLEDSTTFESSEVISCISFQPHQGILSAGTSHGQVVSWRLSNICSDKPDNETWLMEQVLKVQGSIRSIGWNENTQVMGVITATDTYIVSEQEMCCAFKDQISAVQLSARHLFLESQSLNFGVNLFTEVQIKAIFLGGSSIAISTGKRLLFYDVNFDEKKTAFIGTFNSESLLVALHEQSAYIIENCRIEVKTFQGTLKHTLCFMDAEGEPIAIDICSQFLVAVSIKGMVKIWDISRREAKIHAGPKSFESIVTDTFFNCIKCNHKGNKVSMSFKKKKRSGYLCEANLYIWDVDSDTFHVFDFSVGKAIENNDSSDLPGSLDSQVYQANAEIAGLIGGRHPINHFWVAEDPRLIVCEAKLLPVPRSKFKFHSHEFEEIFNKQTKLPHPLENQSRHENAVVSLFISPEQGLLIQDYFFLESNQIHLLGIKIPHYYILQGIPQSINRPMSNSSLHSSVRNSDDTKVINSPITRRTMRDFVGMENCDKTTKEALMAFSYYLTIGNMDEAFKSIKVIKTESVWKNMACMCVKTKRLDVAGVCLGKMGHARGAKALQEMSSEPELDARVAILAVHLGMTEDAEQLLKNCNRYDLLNKLYQDSGQWGKALEVAELHDRIHLRNTYYNYAHHLEAKKDINAAIPMYEKSETLHFEVPRMLFEEPRKLESYIVQSKDPEMQRWWAQYLESIDEMEAALQFYESAEDYLSLVRLYCYCNNLEKASEIANETGDRAACFHLGRQFENQDNIKEAVHFFTRARAYNNAIRICKDNGLEDQLMNLALMSGPQEMADVAHYYEKQNSNLDKAIMLYHKAGYLTKAVELAFKAREFGSLQIIASDLTEHTDPHLLERCAQFFLENAKYEKAIDLFVLAKRYSEALDVCVNCKVLITEELAQKLTLEKESHNQELRSKILEKLGECCFLQENYHLAAKKFTQAGNKSRAMKALLKSSDTEKILFFANVARDKDIYVMAANYLQSLDWRHNPDIMKNITVFYSKAKAFEHLAGFYDACAQDEIDEYQNYEKALGALNEACKSIVMSNSISTQHSEKMEHLKLKLELVKQFVQIRRLYDSNPEDAIRQCQDLLNAENIDIAVRRGDIYGFMVEHYCRQENYKVAYNVLEKMQAALPGINLPYYIKIEHLKLIYKALDIDPVQQMSFLLPKKDENEDEVSENDIEEEEYQAIENGF